ncbi:ATP-binding cassette domain-containing protein [Caldibacillus thermoamylovorans]|uniref:ABC transporter ATP-binding protein n=1 Tax=Caldibacillus thermoamylovorans TaxID=35841 RepID=UPI001D082DB5|nr:ATP-binding cassette domain-containing protein [Caldibacillus thermoamylovorans]MCB5935771.1 ATP-binding cassette domain-containing protein [Bacillus sp. DFI.2.34]MCB7077230.1 ATP-binding cassette domain-containing protein [Caldibacillus thermoamylovorans]
MEAAIKVENITKKFGETTVLDGISLTFEKNKIHGLIGRNGSGKTMLLKCICGFVIPTAGTIYVNGMEIGKDLDVPESVGIIIEAPGFLPNYDGYTNLKFLAAINNIISKEQIYAVIEKVGLDPKSKRPVGKYSLGMRQRLGIAQALMEDPDILILDEPMNGLDNQGVADIRKLLLELRNQGKTIILASHGKEDIEILCDTVHELDRGKVINSIIKERKDILFN